MSSNKQLFYIRNESHLPCPSLPTCLELANKYVIYAKLNNLHIFIKLNTTLSTLSRSKKFILEGIQGHMINILQTWTGLSALGRMMNIPGAFIPFAHRLYEFLYDLPILFLIILRMFIYYYYHRIQCVFV